MSGSIIMLLVFGLFGLVFGLVGLGMLLSARDFKRRAVRVPGRIVALRARRSSGSGSVYYPTVRFTTQYGQDVEAEANYGSNPPIGPVGHQVNVLYDPANPIKFRIDSAWGNGMLFGIIFLGFGVVFLGVSIVGSLSNL